MIIRIALAATLALTACKKSDDKPAGATGGDNAAPAKLEFKKVPSMGIEIEVTKDADVQDNTASAGFPSSTIYSMDGTPTTFLFGAKGDLSESVAISKDFETTKTRIQKEHNGFKSFTKEQPGADGAFELRYVGTDMLEKDKPLYGVTIRKTVAGLTIDCQTNAKSEADIDRAVKLCASVRAAQ